jgi:acetyl/propionyl-CoA carboxylase alpha subunit
MSMEGISRVLIANRGEIARRLIREFRERGIETVCVFSEDEADADWLDDADYAVYLNGKTVDETYLHVQRIISAAHDAGCDAIHPGYCFLAEHADLYERAAAANLPIIGADPSVLIRVVDRFELAAVARHLSIPLIPASGPLDLEADGIADGAQLGVPLFVKARSGGALGRVESLDALPAAVAKVRRLAVRATGDAGVYLERSVDSIRQISTIVVADRHGTAVYLGHIDGSLQVGFRTWVEEMGAVVSPELHDKLGEAAIRLATAVGWVGVCTVKWAVSSDGGWYLLGLSARLTTGYDLVEQVYGVNLIDAQLTTLTNEPLPWTQADAVATHHGIQLRLLHTDPSTGERPDGTLQRLVLPYDGVNVTEGLHVDAACTKNTDPLIAKLTVLAPTRQAALVQAKAALEAVEIEGVATNVAVLERVLGAEEVWQGTHDTATIERVVTGQSD